MEADIKRILPHLAPAGFIWVSWPKKASRMPTDITEDVIREVALPIGLVDVKVCAVDETWSGLKLMIRKELRGDRSRRESGPWPDWMDPYSRRAWFPPSASDDPPPSDKMLLRTSRIIDYIDPMIVCVCNAIRGERGPRRGARRRLLPDQRLSRPRLQAPLRPMLLIRTRDHRRRSAAQPETVANSHANFPQFSADFSSAFPRDPAL